MYSNMERKFVQFKRIGKEKWGKAENSIDDMPYSDWQRIQRDPFRKQYYEMIKIIDLDKNETIENKNLQNESLPVVEDPLECPLCGFIAKNEKSLRMHKLKKHG